MARQFLEEDSDKPMLLLTQEHVPSPPIPPKCYIKQGPVKSSKKQKEVIEHETKNDDE